MASGLLPTLTASNKIGSGASADVYRVQNFLPAPRGKSFTSLAVKKFLLQLEQGLDVAKEDLRRLKLELCGYTHTHTHTHTTH
jgi:hypothetical protein